MQVAPRLSARPGVCVLISLLAALGCSTAGAAEVQFASDVKPLLARRCFSCHGPDVGESELRLHERDLAIGETASGGHAIVPGDPDSSELIARVSAADEAMRMPPEGEPLSPEEIETLRQWIAGGAEWAKHWAFVPPAKQAPPEPDASDWVANPIDAFILDKLEANGLSPAPAADKRTLARRAYYDITGLPPTAEQLADFLADDSPDAYERLVDELLASPHYGERWARHWLDVVRYGETNSYERDSVKPNAWKYRDWVIRSLNEDKPYDQFIKEQLAGDELDQPTVESYTATGYYRLGVWDDEPADRVQARFDELDDFVSTTSQAFLGLTIGCARCHDHKIDPISQAEYYSMVAFFKDVTPYGERGNHQSNNQRDMSSPEERRARQRLERRERAARKKKYELEQVGIARMSAPDQRLTELTQHERAEVLESKLHDHLTEEERQRYEEICTSYSTLTQKLAELPEPEMVLAVAKADPHPAPTHLMMRGNAHAEGEEVFPLFPALFGDAPPEIPPAPADAESAGRRRVLAEWIASPDNMLTSRVIANRVWQHHFGRGIVRSPNNFGQLGVPPTHPELLDWLANYLVEHEWRLKSLHRLVMLSNAYQMSSQRDADALAFDPENNLFWRFDMRRLSAEELRDSVLQVAGNLNRDVYGPSIYPKLSDEVLSTQSRPGDGWGHSSPEEASRRSIYIHIKRSLIPPELANFDFPDPDTTCEARFDTTQPAQALNLLHGSFLQEQAGDLAERVCEEAGDGLDARLGQAIRIVLGREPDEATVSDGRDFIETFTTKYGLTQDEALRQYCLLVLNLNEFIYLD